MEQEMAEHAGLAFFWRPFVRTRTMRIDDGAVRKSERTFAPCPKPSFILFLGVLHAASEQSERLELGRALIAGSKVK